MNSYDKPEFGQIIMSKDTKDVWDMISSSQDLTDWYDTVSTGASLWKPVYEYDEWLASCPLSDTAKQAIYEFVEEKFPEELV